MSIVEGHILLPTPEVRVGRIVPLYSVRLNLDSPEVVWCDSPGRRPGSLSAAISLNAAVDDEDVQHGALYLDITPSEVAKLIAQLQRLIDDNPDSIAEEAVAKATGTEDARYVAHDPDDDHGGDPHVFDLQTGDIEDVDTFEQAVGRAAELNAEPRTEEELRDRGVID